MWQESATLDQRPPSATIQINTLDDVPLGVYEIDPFGRIVDGQAIGPVEFRIADNTLTTTAVDESMFNFSTCTTA